MKNMPSRINRILIVFVMSLIFLFTFFNIRGTLRLVAVILYLIVFSFQSVGTKIALLFYIAVFTADLGISFGIPATSVMQLICIVDYLHKEKLKIEKTFFLCVIMFILLQLYSVLNCGQQIKNIVVYIVNLFLMYLVFQKFSRCKEPEYKKILLFYVLGVAAAVVSGLYRRGNYVESWVRFRGVWTDPNFLGMFCVLACAASLSLTKGKKKTWIFSFPAIILFVYAGYLTQSRAFILAGAILVLFYVYSTLREKNPVWKKTIIILILFLGAYYAYNSLLVNVVHQRGITSTKGATDWTNGRLYLTAINYRYWSKDIFTVLFGYGVNNSMNFTEHVSHNTYADLLFELGLFGTIILLVYFALQFRKINWKQEKVFLIVILFYAASLSMLSTDIVYLFLGLCAYPSRELLRRT